MTVVRMVDKNKLGKGSWTEKTGVGERGRVRGGHRRQKLKKSRRELQDTWKKSIPGTGNNNANSQRGEPAYVSRIEAATPAGRTGGGGVTGDEVRSQG